MKGHTYTPIVTDIRMSSYGYWIVTISAGPGERVSVMACQAGIGPDQAVESVLEAFSLLVT